MVERERLSLPDAGLSPALVLAQRFVQRWDLHARQLDDASYACVHEQPNIGHLFAHLRGEITLGAYLPDQENQARFLLLDVDDDRGWEDLGHLAGKLTGEDISHHLRIPSDEAQTCSEPNIRVQVTSGNRMVDEPGLF